MKKKKGGGGGGVGFCGEGSYPLPPLPNFKLVWFFFCGGREGGVTISAEIITVLTRYRPIVLELI